MWPRAAMSGFAVLRAFLYRVAGGFQGGSYLNNPLLRQGFRWVNWVSGVASRGPGVSDRPWYQRDCRGKIVIALQFNSLPLPTVGLQGLTSMLVNKLVDHALSAEMTATQGPLGG